MAPSHAGNAVGLDEAMITVGLGFRKQATAQDILTAIGNAVQQMALENVDITQIATGDSKRGEDSIEQAARQLRVPVLYLSKAELAAAECRTQTSSSHSIANTGISSFSEAAALAAAGNRSRLLSARIVLGPVTCALAEERRQ